jgi:hypothetical protein
VPARAPAREDGSLTSVAQDIAGARIQAPQGGGEIAPPLPTFVTNTRARPSTEAASEAAPSADVELAPNDSTAKARKDLDARSSALATAFGDQPVPPELNDHIASLVADTHGVPMDALKGDSTSAAKGVAKRDTLASDALLKGDNESEPPSSQPPRPFYDMSPDELEAHAQSVKVRGEQTELTILGGQLRPWQAAQRALQSSNAATSEHARQTIDDIESRLSPGNRDALYGIGDSAHEWDPVDDYRRELAAAQVESPSEAVTEISRQLPKLGDAKGQDPSNWTREQQVAYAAMRELGDRIDTQGWDSKAIQKAALQRAASRYPDPNDAALMLDRFIAPRAKQGGGESPYPSGGPARQEIASPTPTNSDISARPPSDAEVKAEMHRLADTAAGGGAGLPRTPALAKRLGIPAARATALRSEVVAERLAGTRAPRNGNAEATDRAVAEKNPTKADISGDSDIARVISDQRQESVKTRNSGARAADAEPSSAPPSATKRNISDASQDARTPTKPNIFDRFDQPEGGGETPPPSTGASAARKAGLEVENAARESAAHPDNERPEPTPAQQAAGNFASGHVRLHGLDVTIQVPKGGMRRGIDRAGKPWEREASAHYGHLRGTEGADHEPVDVYLGPHAEDPKAKVFVIDQARPGSNIFDEHKSMVGFSSGHAARDAYTANFPKDVKTFGGIREMSIDQFRSWVKDGDLSKPASDSGKVHLRVVKDAAPSQTRPADPAKSGEPAADRSGARAPTATPEFRRFFGDSKVVDAKGDLLVVHHGTGDDFNVFDSKRAGAATEHATSPLGHFFTADEELAKRYAENAADGRPADERVVSAYLKVEKPYNLTLSDAQAIDSPEQARALRAKLEREGYDGIHIPEAKSWIAFKSEQIKSTDNRGTFDATNPDIRYSRSSVVQGDRSSAGLPVENVQRIANDFLKQYNGHIPLKVRVERRMEDIYGPASAKELGNAKGAYHPEGGFLTLAADRVSSRSDAINTLRHEVLGHYGLNTLAPSDKRAVLDAVVAARAEPTLRSTWDRIDRAYADKPELVRAEEVFADLAGQDRGKLGEAWDRILSVVQQALRKIGLIRSPVTRAELHDLARRIGDGIRNGDQPQRTFPANDRAQFPAGAGDATEKASGLRAPLLARRGDTIPGGEHLNEDQRAALGKISTFARGESLPEKWRRATDRLREKLVQGIADQFAPLKMLDREAYMQARLSRGTDGALEATFFHGTPKLTDGALDVTADGKGLRGVLAGLKGEHDLFLSWVAGNRAAKLAAEDREHLFTPEEIKSLQSLDRGKMADGRDRAAAYKATLVELNRYQNAVLDIGEKAGLFTAKSREQWSHEFYVPFFRNGDKPATPAGAVDVSKFAEAGTEKVIQELKGGSQPLGDLLSNTLENWSHILTASMRNMAASKALYAAERIGIAHEIDTASRDSVRVMRDGKPAHYSVSDPLLLDSLTMLNFDGDSNKAVRALGTLKRALSFGVTINPAFRIRNLLRDTMSAMAVSDVGSNPIRNLVEGWRATGENSGTFHKLLASGGAVRFGALNDGEQAAHAKRLIALGMKDDQLLDSPGKIKNALNHAWEWWKEIGDRGETVNRAVIYDRARAKGASHLEAAYQARDLLDFTMGGKWAATQFLVHTVPFLNARIQGLYKLGRGAHENPMRFASVTGAVALASAATYLLQKDDPEFKALPDWARDTYWCVKLGDKMLFLPKPFEIGALGSVVERGTELATAGKDYQTSDFARSLLRVAVDQLSMNPVPQAVKPAMEAFFNYDTFQGRPIDSMGQENLPPADRFTARTSAPAIGVGKAIGMSPQRVEYMLRGYFGWLGVQALNVADLVSRPLTELPSNPNRDIFSVSNWPLAGDFVKSNASMSSKYVDRFYSNQQQTEQLYSAYSAARKAGDVERAKDLAGTDAVRLRTLSNALNRQMTEINQRIRRATSDRSLGATDKRTLLDGLTQQRNRIAEHADARLRGAAQ